MAIWAILGHVCRLHTDQHLNDLQEISGSSSGSLVAFIYSIGRTDTGDMLNKVFGVLDTSKIFKYNIKNFILNYGLIKHDNLRREISRLCFDISNKEDMTFSEHYELTKIKIHIPALSLEKQMNDYFSVDVTPHMSVIDAICMSMSIPFIFPPYMGHLDGSIIETIPFIPFIDKDASDVYVVRITDEQTPIKYKSIQSYIGYILGFFYILRHDSIINYASACIHASNSEIFNFKMSSADRYRLFTRGYAMNSQ